MSRTVKVAIVGAGSAQFSLNLIKDLCLAESLAGSHVSFMDIDEERLDITYRLGIRYAKQLRSPLTFEKTTDRAVALRDANFVINTAFVLGHGVETQMRNRAAERYGYYHFGGHFGSYHQLRLILDLALDMQRVCPDAWLIQLGNPVFDGCTLITRETSIKVCGLCHGYRGYRELATTIGINPDRVTWQAPGLNHNIWLTHFNYQGKDAYPLIDEWINTKGEEYWRTHMAASPYDIQMSRSAAHQYHMYGLFPIGDTVRHGGWWYHTDIQTKKYWFSEPWGGPDTPLAREHFVADLESLTQAMKEWVEDPYADLGALVGTERTQDQTVLIIDGLANNHEGYFQVNVPNRGALQGIPEDVVVEVPAIVNQKGIQPLCVGSLPPKIMIERILPAWLEMERALLAFRTGDKSVLLYGVLDHRQTRSYDQARAALDELMQMDEIIEVENRQRMARISSFFKYPARL